MFGKSRYLILISMLSGSMMGIQACGDDSASGTPLVCDPACAEGCMCQNGACVDGSGNACVDEPEPEVCDPACKEGCTCKDGACVDGSGNACVDTPAEPEPEVCDPACVEDCVCKGGVCVDGAGDVCVATDGPEESIVCDPECKDGCTCKDGICVDGSGTICIDAPVVCDPECKEGCTCNDGVCVDGEGNACVDEPEVCDPACKEGCTCKDGACVDGDGNVCVDEPEPEVCDPACTDGCTCQAGVCVDGSGNACVTPESACDPACTGSAVCYEGKCICPDSLVCEGLTCDPECTAPSVCNATTGKCECPEGETCEALVCEPECAAPSTCVNGKCVCPEGETCAEAPTCDGDCVAPAACVNGKCICPDDANCDGTSGARVCEPACEGLYKCVNGKCECPEGKDCTVVEPVCDPACTGKYTCVEGKCVCPKGETCETTGEPEDDSWLYETEDCAYVDSDGDLIADLYEGRAEKRDSDGDGTPDYLDEDSDNDGVPDKLEAETRNCSGEEPRDRDGDDIPNYLDTDSDNNGIPDGIEIGDINAPVDTDGDKLPDYLDRDNDGDNILDKNEILGIVAPGGAADSTVFAGDCNGDGQPDARGSVEAPIDCDGDTTPDYMDTDSDGDGIPDVVEASVYFNNWYIRYIKDADANGIVDGEEGYTDLDGDGIPNHLDIDNDNDGLADDYEVKYCKSGKCLDPNKADTDGDSHSDMIEIGAQTDPLDPNDDPVTAGNFVFVVPYKGETTPKKQTLSFVTSIQTIDLFFAFDQSGSMDAEVKSLRDDLGEIVNNLKCRDFGATCTENSDCASFTDSICSEQGKCIQNPGSGNGCFDNIWTGLGFYSDIDKFWVANQMNANFQTTVNALNLMFNGSSFRSAGWAEAPYQAPICAALGTSNSSMCKNWGSKNCGTTTSSSSCKMNCSTDKSKVGCVGYRSNAIRIFAEAFDESQCRDYGSSYRTRCDNFRAQVGTIMKQYKMRYVGLYSGTGKGDYSQTPYQVAVEIGKNSNSVSSSSQPFVYKATDSALASKAADGIREIAKNMPIQVTSTVEDMDVANVKDLVKQLNVNVTDKGNTVQGRVCQEVTAANIVAGTYQGIKDLLPGKVVCYDVIPVESQSLFPATREPQVFKARVKVMGDGSVLNSGVAYFLVPPDLSNNFGN